MNIIESAGLARRFGRTWALRRSDLAIPSGRLSYQPASRLGMFQLIESGSLAAVAAALVAATFVLISRRAA